MAASSPAMSSACSERLGRLLQLGGGGRRVAVAQCDGAQQLGQWPVGGAQAEAVRATWRRRRPGTGGLDTPSASITTRAMSSHASARASIADRGPLVSPFGDGECRPSPGVVDLAGVTRVEPGAAATGRGRRAGRRRSSRRAGSPAVSSTRSTSRPSTAAATAAAVDASACATRARSRRRSSGRRSSTSSHRYAASVPGAPIVDTSASAGQPPQPVTCSTGTPRRDAKSASSAERERQVGLAEAHDLAGHLEPGERHRGLGPAGQHDVPVPRERTDELGEHVRALATRVPRGGRRRRRSPPARGPGARCSRPGPRSRRAATTAHPRRAHGTARRRA